MTLEEVRGRKLFAEDDCNCKSPSLLRLRASLCQVTEAVRRAFLVSDPHHVERSEEDSVSLQQCEEIAKVWLPLTCVASFQCVSP